jgi:phage terminase Nu1 subunit (DNA packaging protein)
MTRGTIDPKTVITGSSLAAILGLTARHVADLGDRGVVKRDAAGGYRLHDSVKSYVAFVKADNKNRTKTVSNRRLQDARARGVEIKNAKEERRLIETGEALACLDEVVGPLRSDLDGLPAMVTRDLAVRRKIEGALAEIFKRNSARLAAQAAALESTGEGADEGAPDDD